MTKDRRVARVKVRFEGDEVSVRREGRKVVLEPFRRRAWPPGYWKSWKAVPDDFEAPPPLTSSRDPIDVDTP